VIERQPTGYVDGLLTSKQQGREFAAFSLVLSMPEGYPLLAAILDLRDYRLSREWGVRRAHDSLVLTLPIKAPNIRP